MKGNFHVQFLGEGVAATSPPYPTGEVAIPPCYPAMYTVVALLYAELPARYTRVRVVDWPGKRDVTFSDAITAVRRWLWVEWVFAIPGHREAFSKLRGPFRQIVLNGLAPAP